MKILVFAHRLELGGTQTNAIELGSALRDRHGHEVSIFATPGPAVKLAEEKGLRLLPAPDASVHPSPARMKALRAAVRSEGPDLLHVWDWWQCLEAYYAVHLPLGVPMVVTDMMMDLTRVLPRTPLTTFGTPQIVAQARASGRRRAELLVPAVDVAKNSPGVVDPRDFRERHGIGRGEIALVTVSRLSEWLKSESLVRTIDAVRLLGRELPLRLVIVGDGAVRPRLEELAREANASLGRPAVVLAGAMVDPRPAYAAADIVVGMGSSSMRGMAFGKPVVVVGERGFSAPLDPGDGRHLLPHGHVRAGGRQSRQRAPGLGPPGPGGAPRPAPRARRFLTAVRHAELLAGDGDRASCGLLRAGGGRRARTARRCGRRDPDGGGVPEGETVPGPVPRPVARPELTARAPAGVTLRPEGRCVPR